jgi:hypothetical protein
MNDPKTPASASPSRPPARALGAFLSFLVPGLGQIVQGWISGNRNRLTKGVFFLLALYGMFFYGMYLGDWQNVYIPHVQEQLIREGRPLMLFGVTLSPFAGDIYTRLQYAGQFWIGIAAWPALWNYFVPDTPIISRFQASPGSVPPGKEFLREQSLRQAEAEQIAAQLAPNMGKYWDVAWVYTVIAGVLNLLVIYDAWAGPVYRRPAPDRPHSPSGNNDEAAKDK